MSLRTSYRLPGVVLALVFALVGTMARAASQDAPIPDTGPAPARSVERTATGSNGSGPVAPGEATVRQRTPSPMMLEMMAALEGEQTQLQELKTRLAGTKDPAAFLAIQREVEQVKLQTEIALLRIQSTYARRDGRKEVADRIDNAIEEMLRPVPRGVPATRPAPTGDPAKTSR